MFELVHIATKEDAMTEGQALKHAVGLLYERLTADGVMVYSVRENGVPVLTLSVRNDDQGGRYCDHVVGLHNRAPTEAELTTVSSLLLHHNVALRYDPHTTQ